MFEYDQTTTYTSPVPMPARDATPAAICREVYGMPTYLSVPTADLAASVRFWTDGLGFVDFFTVPGVLTHLRRWAFQDVLLVPGEPDRSPPASAIAFSCVRAQLDEVVAACERLVPGCTSGPATMPWNSVEVTVVTPENVRVVLTAALPIDPGGETAAALREQGYDLPEP